MRLLGCLSPSSEVTRWITAHNPSLPPHPRPGGSSFPLLLLTCTFPGSLLLPSSSFSPTSSPDAFCHCSLLGRSMREFSLLSTGRNQSLGKEGGLTADPGMGKDHGAGFTAGDIALSHPGWIQHLQGLAESSFARTAPQSMRRWGSRAKGFSSLKMHWVV